MRFVVEIARDWRAMGSLRDAVEVARLARLPRRQRARTRLLGRELALVDGASFVSAYREIFGRGIYFFEASRPDPLVLDVGANVGLAVLYFKRLYPRARVRAFEADPDVLAVLRHNVAGLEGVELVGRAAWTGDGNVSFHPEGADAGRLRSVDGATPIQVPCTRLRDHLGGRVDLLKMDIEGAEADVLADCAGHLEGVERIFVEYHSFAGERQRLPDVLGVLTDAGFRLWVESPVSAPRPFIERPQSLGMDLQLNVFGVRS